MRARILGSAAGGGLPQWNCGCRNCRGARRGDIPGRAQASLAVALGSRRWAIVNATSDIRAQLNAATELRPPADGRRAAFRRVLLTDAQLDHVLGLLELRQAERLEVCAPPGILAAVRDDLGLGATLGAYVAVQWVPLPVGESTELDEGFTVRPIATGGRRPRYARAAATLTASGDAAEGAPEDARADGFEDASSDAWSVAYELRDGEAALVYAPTVGEIDGELARACRSADGVLFDGTFWSDEEPIVAGIGPRPARAFGHLPIDGPGGSLQFLAACPAAYRAYTHLNNTNPLLDPASPQAGRLEGYGLRVAGDGEDILL